MRNFILCGCFFIIYQLTFAQNFSIEKFATPHPFPSAELYDIIEDHLGNKWVSSDIGIFKIRGNSVDYYTTKNGLGENVILKFFKGLENRIWFVGLSGTLGLIEHGDIQKNNISNVVFNSFSEKTYISSLVEKENYVLEFRKVNDSKIYLADDKSLKYRTLHTINHQTVYISIYPDKQHLIVYSNTEGKIKGVFDWIIKVGNQEYKYSNLFQRPNQNNRVIISNDSTIYVSNTNEIIKFIHFKPVHKYTLPHEVFCITQINQKIYCGVRNNGLYLLEENSIQKVSAPIIEKLSISKVLLDKEGNIWFTTLDKGLYICKNPQLQSIYKGENNVVKFLDSDSNKIDILLSNNTLLSRNLAQKLLLNNKDNIINDIIFHNREKLYITSNGLLPEQKSYIISFFLKGYKQLNKYKYILFGSGNVFLFNKYNNSVQEQSLNEKILCVEPLSQNVVWAGTQNKGIYRLKIDSNNINSESLGYNFRVNTLCKIDHNLIAVGTNEKGCMLLNSKGQIIESIENLPQRVDCLAYQDGLLFIGTRVGLYVYHLKSKKTTILNSSNFLPFDEIVDVKASYDYQLYIAGKYEVSALDIEYIKNLKLDIQLNILSISHPIDKNKPVTIHQKENFNISCIQNNYKASQNIVYHFIIIASDGTIIKHQKTKQNSLDIKLPAGNYTLKMYASDYTSLSKSNEIVLSLNIPTFFYQTWWFIVLSTVLFFIILFLIIQKIIRNIKIKELAKRSIQQRISDLESRALQSQMNPHFIFNAINSIQAFILQNRNEEAHFYLAEFAKLIRMILNNSRKKSVTIQEELELLKIYILLESQRLNSPIQFKTQVDSNIDIREFIIPTMILQPILENAIWHGLSGENKEKIIEMRFSIADDFLIVDVFNNGKPFLTKEKNKNQHTSQGLQIIKERVLLLHQNQNNNLSYFDIRNVENGVLVKIIFPLLTEFD
ncbi:MAG: histidine kinase [Raineya sp.]|nr:histidine kinase [Raineya sp.]